MKNYPLLILTMLLMLATVASAATQITSNGITTPEVNQAYYVTSGSAADIQTKINACSSDSGLCTVYVSPGLYGITRQINLTSNLNLVFLGGSEVYIGSGAVFNPKIDRQGTPYNAMFYGHGLKNVKITNYGIMRMRSENNPANGEVDFFINNSDKVYYYGGHVQNTSHPIGVFNSRNVVIENVFGYNLSQSATFTECNFGLIINNIIGYNISEVVDSNGYDQNVVISNVFQYGGRNGNQETLDINGARNVVISNIVAKNASRPLTITETGGVRFGTCPTHVGGNVVANSIYCENCNQQYSSNARNISLHLANSKGVHEFIVDTRNNPSIVASFNGSLGATTLDGNILKFTRNGANIIEASGGTSSQLYFRTGGVINRLFLNEVGKAGFGTTSFVTGSSFDFNGSSAYPTIMAIRPRTDNASLVSAELRLYGDKDNVARYSGIRNINGGGTDVNSLEFVTGTGSAPKPQMRISSTGEINMTSISADGSGKVVCIKADTNLGTCSSAVGAGGTCTCG